MHCIPLWAELSNTRGTGKVTAVAAGPQWLPAAIGSDVRAWLEAVKPSSQSTTIAKPSQATGKHGAWGTW